MAEYIDKQKVLKLMRYAWDENGWDTEYGWLRQHIADEPAADVRENVRGEWIHKYTHESLHDRTGIWCSACGRDALQDSEGYYIEDCETDFCPHCGADLRGEKDGK